VLYGESLEVGKTRGKERSGLLEQPMGETVAWQAHPLGMVTRLAVLSSELRFTISYI